MPVAVRAAAPCAADPDRWLDRRRRTEALLGCLQCSIRRVCAREALRTNATQGMWAGVWLDEDRESAMRRLRALVDDAPPPPVVDRAPRYPEPRRPQRSPLPRRGSLPRCSVAAAVDARASGHCEVMAPGCRLAGDRHLSRVPGRHPAEAMSPAENFCVCRRCAEMIDSTDGFGRQSGFRGVAAETVEHTPVHWRAAHWVLLGHAGELTEVDDVPAEQRARPGAEFAA